MPASSPPQSSESSLPCSSLFITALIGQLAACSRSQEFLDDSSKGLDAADDEGGSPGNPLSQLPADAFAKVKPLLLTLHCLFPNELLLALDILDRNLVTKYTIRPKGRRGEDTHRAEHEDDGSHIEVYCGDDPRQQQQHTVDEDDYDDGCSVSEIYFVLSSASKRKAGAEEETRLQHREIEYQVFLDAWNCTCPAFTLATFRDIDQDMNEQLLQTRNPANLPTGKGSADVNSKEKNWVFGGCLTQRAPCTSSPTGCCFMHDSPPICKHLLACVLASRCPGLFGGKIRKCEIDSREFAGKLVM